MGIDTCMAPESECKHQSVSTGHGHGHQAAEYTIRRVYNETELSCELHEKEWTRSPPSHLRGSFWGARGQEVGG